MNFNYNFSKIKYFKTGKARKFSPDTAHTYLSDLTNAFSQLDFSEDEKREKI